MQLISLSIGTIWRWGKSSNRIELLRYLKDLNIEGIELMFATNEQLLSYQISKADLSFLRTMHISVHAPTGILQDTEKYLDLLQKICTEVNAKNLIIHPQYLPDSKILAQYSFKVSTENMPKKHHIGIPELKKLFKKYPSLGLCLDVAHAYYWSPDETANIVDCFRGKITQVHLSSNYRRQDHQSLKKVSKQFMKSIRPIFTLDVPMVVEEDITTVDQHLLIDEIKHVRELFEAKH